MSSSSNALSSSENSRKKSTDRHLKVDGRDRRVQLPQNCTKLLYELSRRLGHRTMGQTIQWLLVQAKPSVDAVIGTNSTTAATTAAAAAATTAATFPLLVPNPNVMFPFSHTITPYNFGFAIPPNVPVVASAPIPSGQPSFASPKDDPDHDVNISAEAIEKFLSEFTE